jgi:hypothetical protein
MAIASSDLIIKQDLVDRFNTRVRDYVNSYTNWTSGTGVWNTNVGVVTSRSTSYGGGVNRTSYSTTLPTSAALGNFTDLIGAKTTSGFIVKAIKSLMTEYAKTHKVYLQNTGNLGSGSYTGSVRLNGAPSGTTNNVINDLEADANARNITSGSEINAAQLNAFVEACRGIWYNRCYAASQETFKYSYCHSSCHTNYTCYNSRGRR